MPSAKKPQSRARRKFMKGECPICNESFKSDKCPHTFQEAHEEVDYQELKERLVDDLLAEGIITRGSPTED